MYISRCKNVVSIFSKMISACCGYLLDGQHLLLFCIAIISTIFGILFGYMRSFGNVLIGLTFDLLLFFSHINYVMYPYLVSTKYNDTIGLLSLHSIKYGLINGLNVEAIVYLFLLYLLSYYIHDNKESFWMEN